MEKPAHLNTPGLGKNAPPGVWILLLLILVGAYFAITHLASTRTSVTFDEIGLIAGGARGFQTGRFDLVPDNPPLALYMYGLPSWLMNLRYPTEPQDKNIPGYLFSYSRQLLWREGNDAEAMIRRARCLATLCGALLGTLTFFYARRAGSPGSGFLATGLVVCLPDVLAHGGVAYNDLPLALVYLACVWAADEAVRTPTVTKGAFLGLLVSVGLGIKLSAVAIFPTVLGLAAIEGIRGRRDNAWRRAILLAGAVGVVVLYFGLVLICRGDLGLSEIRNGFALKFWQIRLGHQMAPAYLLGRTSWNGWWYFYPVTFLLKTPLAFQVLCLIALVAAFSSRRHPKMAGLRGPALGAAGFVAALVGSSIAIGFRYALPVLPLICVLVAVQVSRIWRAAGMAIKIVIAAAVLWHAASTLSWYPHFLAYTSEFVRSRDDGHEALLDSSLDWGQALPELRRWMQVEKIDSVYLSYFGSALPESYGISYVALDSFLALPEQPPRGSPPVFAVISATNLHSLYLDGDPFAAFRRLRPYRVLGHSLFVYRLPPGFLPVGRGVAAGPLIG